LLQLPVSFVYSACIDLAMMLCSFVQSEHYFAALLFTLLGCVFRAFGVSCQVVADVVMLSAEAFVKAVADVTKKEFSVLKLVSDAGMVVIAVVLSVLLFGHVEAVREGTLMTAVLVGPISHVFTRKLGFTHHYFENEGSFVYETKFKLVEGKPLVLTITSESGSGGRVIAKLLSERLGIPVYDKELVELVAREGHFATSYVRKHNERLYTNIVEAFVMENYTLDQTDMESYRNLYAAQCSVIKRLAEQQSCIIVGHCANHVLRYQQGSLHLHICANPQARIAHLRDKYNISVRKAVSMIEHQDADTEQYYRHFTGQNWKEAANYNLTIDSSMFGYEGTAQMIEQLVKKNYMSQPKDAPRGNEK
jgi:cytidylate kinase